MTIKETVAEAIKAAPPVGVTGATLMGLPLSDWAIILTIVYTLLQIFLLVRKMVKGDRKG